MPKAEYTDSDLWVKDCLERLFWIEIAKRKAQAERRDVFSELIAIRRQLEAYFEGCSNELSEPCEYGEEVVFNIVQFGWHMAERVSEPEHAELIKCMVDRFYKPIDDLIQKLHYHQGFWISEFTLDTDLIALHNWWSYITSNKGRRELGTKGKYSTIGEARPIAATEEIKYEGDKEPTIRVGDLVSTISSLAPPVRFPCIVDARPFWLHTTDESSITIDGYTLEDRLVLQMDLLKPLPSMKKIEAMLITKQRAARARRVLEMLNQGILPPENELYDNDRKDLFLDLATSPPESHKLMTAANKVRPMLAGLLAWDYIFQGMTDSQAAKKVSEELLGNEGAVVFTQAKVVRALRDVVRPLIEKYQPGQLSWNS